MGSRIIMPDAAQATPDKSQPLVFFHYPCADGFTAAWCAWRKHPDWEYIGVSHADLETLTESLEMVDGHWMGEDIYFLDICPKRDVLEKLAELIASSGKKIVIVDHHKSAQAELEGFVHPTVSVIFDMERSGAGIAWSFFWPELDTPRLVAFVQDRDLWRFQIDGSREVNLVLFSHHYDFSLWEQLYLSMEDEDTLDEIIRHGIALQRKHIKDIEEMIANGVDWQVIGGWEVPVLNAPYFYASEAGNLLCVDRPFAATWYERDGARYYSLRSQEGVGLDVSEIARMYGGGGHKHAAGFTLKLPFVMTDLSAFVKGADA